MSIQSHVSRRMAIGIAGMAALLAVVLPFRLTMSQSTDRGRPTGTSDQLAAQKIADSTAVPGATPSSACELGRSHCFADSRSVIATANAVFEAMRKRTSTLPSLRCFPHRAGMLLPASAKDTQTLVDSCVVDVSIDGHYAYAYVDPLTSGPATHLAVHGSTVSFHAE